MTQPFDNRDWDVQRLEQKDAEIERLKEDLWTAKQDVAALAIRRTHYEALLTRAADALEKVASYASGDPVSYRVLRLAEQQFIAELRHAAQ